MKKLLIVFGVLFLSFLVGATILGVIIFRGLKLNASAQAYVDESVPAITAHWSKDELISRASPELLAVAPADQLDHLFIQLAELGPLDRYQGASGQVNYSVTSQQGKVVTAHYLAKADFKNGQAEIQIELIKRNGGWQFLKFFVNSPMFAK